MKEHDKAFYVITRVAGRVKYYYMGSGSRWTPMAEGAKRYEERPEFEWITTYWHRVERISL